jgi:hypothetical protein
VIAKPGATIRLGAARDGRGAKGIANQVETVSGHVPKMLPTMFVARDHETGAIVGVKFLMADLTELFTA